MRKPSKSKTYKRLQADIKEKKYNALHIKLIKTGETMTRWLREAVDFYLQEVK